MSIPLEVLDSPQSRISFIEEDVNVSPDTAVPSCERLGYLNENSFCIELS